MPFPVDPAASDVTRLLPARSGSRAMQPGVSFLDASGPEGVALYAIGDVHGRLDLLTAMHEAIAADRERRQPRDWRIIHLGDYVDRGPDSRGVIDFLIRAGEADERVLSLAGNHDIGFLDFLAKPDAESIFARYGGTQTALSYGVALDLTSADRLLESHAELADAVPARHVDFMRSLLFSVAIGDFFFCHAGIAPGIALEAQDPQVLIWIRDEFHMFEDLHPKVIVHGHTPTHDPEILPNRVNVDTGAFKTGRLTSLVIHGQDKQLLSIEGTRR